MSDELCALCQNPLDDTTETASDGAKVHEKCAEDYEDNIYFREFWE